MMADTQKLLVTPQQVADGLAAGTLLDGNGEAEGGRLRVIDCTVRFETHPVGASTIHSGRDQWLQGHIPGAAYLHMVDDLSDPAGAYPFALAPQSQIDSRLSAIGIEPDDTVVLYGAGTPVAVTRAWWVLRVSGLADVRIMDGGWAAWQAGGHPVATGEETFTPSTFRGARQADAVADRDAVRRAMQTGEAQLLNALSREQFAGTGGTHYGRPGRIPASISCPANDILDPVTGQFATIDEMRRAFAAIDPDRPVITYCGGGIAAAAALFGLHRIGHRDLSLYDSSLLEWSTVPDLPMETDGD